MRVRAPSAAPAALWAIALSAVFLLFDLAEPAGAVQLKPLGASFDKPIYATGASGDRHRLFVVEREGSIRVYRDGHKMRRPFLRIPGGVSTDRERGLISMAFDPHYERNRKFYVLYTTLDGDLRVDEFKRRLRRPNRAARGTQRRVIRIEHSMSSTHYGGQLQFGHDGLLHISTGDAGGQGDPDRNAQDRSSLLGKILRIHPRPSTKRGYVIPRDNPFVGQPGARNEIWAYGLRNPFHFSFDRQGGHIAIADVGQDEVEEIDYRRRSQTPGANFGWNCFEGSQRYVGVNSVTGNCLEPKGSHVPPVLERLHSTGDCSIIGGYVARHGSLGSLRGDYIYGDFCTGRLRAAKLRLRGALDDRDLGVGRLGPDSLVSFGEDGRGRLYVVAQDGRVFRLLNRG